MMKKFYIAIILLCMLTGLTGCGEQQEALSEEIQLLEPANAIVATEAVTYRNLYDAEIFHANVFPYIEEYAFENSGEVEKFTALPGETVKAGEVLVYSNTESVDEAIEKLEEKIAQMDEDYLEYKQDVEEELAGIRDEAEDLQDIVESYEEDEPEEYVLNTTTGVMEKNEEYTAWEKEYDDWDGEYRTKNHDITIKETALRQKTELYNLDRSYNMEKLTDLKEQRDKCILKAGMDGEIVAIGQTEYGTFNAKADKSVVAVGSMSRKIVKCNYMKKAVVTKAQEIYAIINGKKYELEYQPYETEEYLRLTESGESVYTIFEVLGDTDEVQAGDYAVIVMMNDRRENVLTIPDNAIYQDSYTHYVYVIENGQSQRRDIKKGMSDGIYTEITSGLKAGEQVMVQELLEHGTQETVVGTGSYHDTFFKTGMIYYPSITDVKNPVQYGTAYYVERNVKLYQHVEKGDVIATIRVVSDEVELRRNELKLQRLQERLQDLVDEDEPEENEDSIREKQEAIDELSEKLREMRKDAQTIHITAPVAGIIVQVEAHSEDEVLKEECMIAQIADENTCYLMIENTNNMMQYGDDVTITYKNQQKQECTAPGKIVNASATALSKALQTEKLFVLLPTEYVAEMTAAEKNNADVWTSRAKYTVTANVKEMNNVPVVPRKAVTQISGRTYVHVIDENGEIKAQSFIAGGQDASNFWVVEGLTEGMKICLE